MLDHSMWSIRSMLGGSCLQKSTDLAFMSLDNMRTISLGKGWGYSLYSAELAKTIGKWNVTAISVARSVSSRPST